MKVHDENSELELLDLFIRKTYEIYGANTDFDRGAYDNAEPHSFSDASYLSSVYEFRALKY